MTDAQIIQMARDAGSIDSDETILTVCSVIRSATKEEDAGICRHLTQPSLQSRSIQDAWANGTLDCESAIRASK